MARAVTLLALLVGTSGFETASDAPETGVFITGDTLSGRVAALETLDDGETPAPMSTYFKPVNCPEKRETLAPTLRVAYQGYAEVSVPFEPSADGGHVDFIYIRDAHTGDLVSGMALNETVKPQVKFQFDKTTKRVNVYSRHTECGLWYFDSLAASLGKKDEL